MLVKKFVLTASLILFSGSISAMTVRPASACVGENCPAHCDCLYECQQRYAGELNELIKCNEGCHVVFPCTSHPCGLSTPL